MLLDGEGRSLAAHSCGVQDLVAAWAVCGSGTLAPGDAARACPHLIPSPPRLPPRLPRSLCAGTRANARGSAVLARAGSLAGHGAAGATPLGGQAQSPGPDLGHSPRARCAPSPPQRSRPRPRRAPRHGSQLREDQEFSPEPARDQTQTRADRAHAREGAAAALARPAGCAPLFFFPDSQI